MFRRKKSVASGVEVVFDGKKVRAGAGEPLLVTLLAAGAVAVSRSPKLHRPRGPFCARGDCDGCLARVDDVPNVMTCMARVRGGERVEAQNVVGTRDFDLLRITDWFFPSGIDHHHLLAGVPGASDVMQAFARRMAGMGRLPTQTAPPRTAERKEVDVLVVGGGLAGLTAASELSRSHRTLLVDESFGVGGAARHADPTTARRATAIDLSRVDVRSATTLVGFFDGEALAANEGGAVLIAPKRIVLATGAHDTAPIVPNNDLPGVMSARAFAALVAHGLEPTVPIVVVGAGPWAERVTAITGGAAARVVAEADVVAFEGTSRVRGVRTVSGDLIPCGIVTTALQPAPAFELGVQLGVGTRPTPTGFALDVGDAGESAVATVWATGECAGLAFDGETLSAHARRAAAEVSRSLA